MEQDVSAETDLTVRNLENSTNDKIASVAKSILGMVPIAGPSLSEFVSAIPGQRLDRVAKFLVFLDDRVRELEKDLEKLLDENQNKFVVEDGIYRAAGTFSEERLEELANIVASGLSSEQISLAETSHLVKVLDELNEPQVVMLTSYGKPRDRAFFDQHEEILRPPRRSLPMDQERSDRISIFDSYKTHLVTLGLLEATGSNKGYQLSSMGRLLLRRAGLI